jgi:hypothetical protein
MHSLLRASPKIAFKGSFRQIWNIPEALLFG